ncbi:Tnks2, partial [Symbiodinium sp. CCMP2592]
MAEGKSERASVFPLPLPSVQKLRDSVKKRDARSVWFFLVIVGLNYLNGGMHCPMQSFTATPLQSEILDYLSARVDCFLDHPFVLEKFDWSVFLQSRSLSYANEEVRTAKWTTWANVKPALPQGSIASIAAVDLAEDGVLDLLLSPSKYLVPNWGDSPVKSSRVMVLDQDWDTLARGLVNYNLCAILPESALCHPGGEPLLNGMFGVEKGEVCEGIAIHRLIMNLIPLNSISVPVSGDVGTLPLLHQMSSLQLHPSEELVISSEDIRCFFYLFRLPCAWYPFLGFGKPVPPDLVPPGTNEKCYLAAKVVPMGYLNSVGIAQHLHRNFLKKAQGPIKQLGPFNEVRKDRTFPLSNPVWRVYLDNLDVLQKTSPDMAMLLEGKPSSEVSPLIAAYEASGIPLNPKKSAQQEREAEVQGADVQGSAGWCRPKKDKLQKYVSATLSLLRRARCSQKELQIVGGGLVYFAMFRRPLMSCLNFTWSFIQSFEEPGARVRPIPGAVMSELSMFICLLPLAHIDFRLNTSDVVTASDASLTGGGVCASKSETALGRQVGQGYFRGETILERPDGGIVFIGVRDGISSVRVALEALQANVCLHISIEAEATARRIVETNFSDVVFIDHLQDATPEMLLKWAGLASMAKLVIVGVGSQECGADEKGTSSKGAQKNLASMNLQDKEACTRAADVIPFRICSSVISPCRRDRLYWFDWTLEHEEGVELYPPTSGKADQHGFVAFNGKFPFVGCLEPGWALHPASECLSTFTAALPSKAPREKPAGIARCDNATLERWKADRYRFPPYQYLPEKLIWHPAKGSRLPSADERERCLGFPCGYTLNVLAKTEAKSNPTLVDDLRMTALGNAWSVVVVAFLLLQLLRPHKLCLVQSLHQLVLTLFGDRPMFSNSLLAWHQLGMSRNEEGSNERSRLVPKLITLLSGKGNDILIQMGATLHDHQRFRTTIPSKLWSWRTICGWPWPAAETDHINRFELRAVYTALRWRVLRRKELKTRFIHLTDSMVCLHVLSRGRSSSRKIQSLMYRISSLLLATGLHPFLAYVSTHTNPADRPSRRIRVRRKWGKQRLGSLRSNTVTSRTKQRYEAALKTFYLYAQTQGLRIPDDADGVDEIFAEFIEHLWEEGESLSVATDGLSGLQDLRPKFRGSLSLSWRLVKTWQKKEVAFYCLLRTGELLQLQASHIDVSPNLDFAVISLGLTKTSQ